jgi:hypothetical protein
MMQINKQDVFKTVLIFWFIAATGYFVYDQYDAYKLKGLQRAQQVGYVQAVDDLIKKTEESGCQPFDVAKEDKKVSIVSAQCLSGQQAQTETLQTKDGVKK